MEDQHNTDKRTRDVNGCPSKEDVWARLPLIASPEKKRAGVANRVGGEFLSK